MRRILLAASLLLVFTSCAAVRPRYPVAIRNGAIYDGTGKAPVRGDLAIAGDRIVLRDGEHAGAKPGRVVRGASVLAGEFVQKSQGGMSYLLFVPPPKAGGTPALHPLILWMHGGGTRGTDPKKIISFGDTTGPLYFAREDIQRRYPSIVVAPLCPADRFWTDESKRVFAIVDEVTKRHPVDPRRIYVVGMSMGGYAAWDLISRRPAFFAAAIPICGGGDPSRGREMSMTAVWAFHGVLDDRVDVDESRRLIAAIRRAGGKPRYSEYPNEEHNVWHAAFKEPELLSWLFAQRRIK